MKSYHELRNEINCEQESKKRKKLYLLLCYLLKGLFSEVTITLISAIPFFLFYWLCFGISIDTLGIGFFYLTVHFLFYEFYLKNNYRSDLKPDYDEICLAIIILNDLIIEHQQQEIDKDQT